MEIAFMEQMVVKFIPCRSIEKPYSYFDSCGLCLNTFDYAKMKYSKIVLIPFLLLVVINACLETPGMIKTSGDPFIEYIRSSTLEMDVAQQSFIESPTLFNPLLILAINDTDYIVTADYVDKFIKVIDSNGTLLSETGGEGRGPGEYALINQIERGPDGLIYVLDKRLNRIHTYNLDDETGELTLRTTTPYKHEANSHISSLYVTEFGMFGVFTSLTNYETWENSYYLYELDENFQPVTLLLELPGNDKIPAREDGIGKIDNFLGSMTHWDLDGEWFYYITSKKTNVYAYNLISGQQYTLTAIMLNERVKTDGQREYIKKTYDRLIESTPSVETAINEASILPYFDSLTAQDGNLILRLFDAGSETGILIHYNTETGNVRHIRVPTYFYRI
jgi:hypothetical protein